VNLFNRDDVTEESEDPIAGIHLHLNAIVAEVHVNLIQMLHLQQLQHLRVLIETWESNLVDVSHLIVFN